MPGYSGAMMQYSIKPDDTLVVRQGSGDGFHESSLQVFCHPDNGTAMLSLMVYMSPQQFRQLGKAIFEMWPEKEEAKPVPERAA